MKLDTIVSVFLTDAVVSVVTTSTCFDTRVHNASPVHSTVATLMKKLDRIRNDTGLLLTLMSICLSSLCISACMVTNLCVYMYLCRPTCMSLTVRLCLFARASPLSEVRPFHPCTCISEVLLRTFFIFILCVCVGR